jgi:hypothetical protein
MLKYLKGFGKYRVCTYCTKDGIRINYFKTEEQMKWAVESDISVWKLVKVQSRFLKRDFIKLENV